MLGFPILYFKGMRLLMFQLSGFHCSALDRVCRDSTGLAGFYGSVGFWGY